MDFKEKILQIKDYKLHFLHIKKLNRQKVIIVNSDILQNYFKLCFTICYRCIKNILFQ